MMKLIVFLCFVSSGECQWLPWTANPVGPTEGSPILYSTAAECEGAGKFLLTNHNGMYWNWPPSG
jgi:hypothetical protein